MEDLREHTVGNGHVFNQGQEIAAVRYAIQVFQAYIETASQDEGRSQIPGSPRITIHISDSSAPIPLGESLTLVMEDGRKIDFIAVGQKAFRATGGMY